jgi:hypothetical protein
MGMQHLFFTEFTADGRGFLAFGKAQPKKRHGQDKSRSPRFVWRDGRILSGEICKLLISRCFPQAGLRTH